jgi:hypothetical protein
VRSASIDRQNPTCTRILKLMYAGCGFAPPKHPGPSAVAAEFLSPQSAPLRPMQRLTGAGAPDVERYPVPSRYMARAVARFGSPLSALLPLSRCPAR